MRLNQTQRNYIAENIAKLIEEKLTEAGKKVTPLLFLEIGYGTSEKSIFSFNMREDYRGKNWALQWNLNSKVQWASGNVCESKKEIQTEILGYCGDVPPNWYKEEWEAGNYKIIAEFPDCITSTNNGPPRLNIEWPNHKKALTNARKGYPKRITTAIQQTVEAYQTINEHVVDSVKFMKKAQRKAMLADVANAETLFNTLSIQTEQIFK